jgi:hypothetical protein
LLGKLAALGYGPTKIVPVAFHVDYFNDPWKDPFSDPSYSKREWAYNEAQDRKDLYFTPMMMIDGRYPMLGSDQPKARAALDRALKQRPGVTLGIDLSSPSSSRDDPRRRTLAVTVSPLSAEATDRDLLVGVAITEDPVTTAVPSGENKGKTLVEHHAVRKFVFEKVQLSKSQSKELSFPLELPADADPARCRVAVFVQDWMKGQVHQADGLRWTNGPESGPEGEPKSASTKNRPVPAAGVASP